MKKEFIAYEGEELTIEWYFNSRGKSKAFEYFQELTFDCKKKVLHLFRLLGDMGNSF